MADKYGDLHGWSWHVYENEGHGMGYQVELKGKDGREFLEGGYLGPEMGSRENAEQVVELFRKTWGGTYTFHSLADWYAEMDREEERGGALNVRPMRPERGSRQRGMSNPRLALIQD